MSETRTEHFETHQPISLYVEIGKGTVHVEATDTSETRVEVTGRDAAEVEVALKNDHLVVVGPRQRTGFLSGDHRLDVTVVLPSDSELATRTGSADITATGRLGTTQVKSGSGDVALETLGGAAAVETGSGDVRIENAEAELKVKSGSGDVVVGHAGSAVAVSTGSGDVEIGASHGPAIVKTGSGDLTVTESAADVSLSTASGDLVIGTARRGRLSAKGASGDVHVGIPAGIPVWTDVTTVTGAIRSSLEGAGRPEDGADHVELRAKTVSGDIVLTQV